MASVIKRNRRRWKGVKWIDTPFARHKRRLWMHRVMAISQLEAGKARIAAIRFSQASPAEKKIAIAETVLSTVESATKVIRQAK